MSKCFAVIGAGSSGLAAAKHLKAQGLRFELFELSDDVGGNWYFNNPNSRIYQTTHLISSKPLTEFNDFPMPADFPDYPHHALVHRYLKSYAEHFGLYPYIHFNTAVKKLTRLEKGKWQVTFASGNSKTFDGVIIANGHNWKPRWPNPRGSFSGQIMHSAQYKSPTIFDRKRVLVVGAGNSGCDIAVDAAQRAAKVFHSVRRGYYYLPKYLAGKPADQFGEVALRWRVPLWLRRIFFVGLLRFLQGRPERLGLPKPDHKLFETHPIVNSQLLYYLGHGDLVSKPDVDELCGDKVRFVDGSEESIDLIVYATGYEIAFPFIDLEELNWKDNRPHFFLNVFHPEADDLFIIGLIQPDSGQFGLVDYQAELVAKYLKALGEGSPRALRFQQQKKHLEKARLQRISYLPSQRHLLEVEHFSYRQSLKKCIRFVERKTLLF